MVKRLALAALMAAVLSAQEPVVPAPAPPQPVKVGAGVVAGLRIKGPAPVYLAEARAARVQGTVLLTARISKNSQIVDLRVASGPPELRQASLEAVRQWEYRPYLINGEPVEVDTQIEVNFRLN